MRAKFTHGRTVSVNVHTDSRTIVQAELDDYLSYVRWGDDHLEWLRGARARSKRASAYKGQLCRFVRSRCTYDARGAL